MPLYERDHRHDDGTGWRGGAVLAVVMCIIAAGHAAANAASAQRSSRQTCSPGVRTTYKGKQITLSFNAGQRRVSLVSSARARLVLAPGRHAGTFSGKDLPGNTVTRSFTC
jgi:hypothetical protein